MPSTILRHVVFVALLATLFLLAGCVSPSAPDPTATPIVVLPTPVTVAEAALARLRPFTDSGVAHFGAWAPDGQQFAYVINEYERLTSTNDIALPGVSLWLASPGGHDTRQIAKGAAPVFSPDGNVIYFWGCLLDCTEGGWWALPLTEKKPWQIDFPPEANTAFHWLLDDGRLVFSGVGSYQPLMIYNPANRQVSSLLGPLPTNMPDTVRISPDGMMMVYSFGQGLYLADLDATHPQVIATGSDFGTGLGWSPDSQWLALTSGGQPNDKLLLADRSGTIRMTLVERLEDFGYPRVIAWAPDSRRLLVVAASFYEQPVRPDWLYLFDVTGQQHLLLEAYLQDIAWSPDGRTIAMTRWDGLQGDVNSSDVWLAEITDTATVASLPAPSPAPEPTSLPPLPLPPAGMSPEDVVRRYWEAIDVRDYYTAWAAQAPKLRERVGLAWFSAGWECTEHVRIISIAGDAVPADATEAMVTAIVEVQDSAQCPGESIPPGAYVRLIRENPESPWLIADFFSGG